MSDARRTHRTDESPEVGVARASFMNVPGSPVETRRQMLVKVAWMLLWMTYLAYPVSSLVNGGHSTGARVLGWICLGFFVG
ncbi:hypothetical protein ABTY56_25665, partial [Kitasatospora sp. NPDC097691]